MRRWTCSRREPITDYPLFDGYPNVVVTPHLGASTAEAQDRAGVQTAEQVVAALTGGVVSSAVNIPAISPEDMDVLGPFVPLVDRLGAAGDGAGGGLERRPRRGRVLRPDRRARHAAADARRAAGVLSGHCEEDVNLVNAPSLAEERGIAVVGALGDRRARLHRPRPRLDRLAATSATASPAPRSAASDRPHLLEAWGQRFNLQLDEGAHMALFRYHDLPGMMGRVGTVLGERGVNISSAAVGRQPPGDDGRRDEVAVMVVTTDSPVPRDVVERDRALGRLPRRPRGVGLGECADGLPRLHVAAEDLERHADRPGRLQRLGEHERDVVARDRATAPELGRDVHAAGAGSSCRLPGRTIVQSSELAATRASASALARRYGRIDSGPRSGSCAPIEETITKRATPAASAASTHLTGAAEVDGALALSARAGPRAGGEDDRVGAADVRLHLVALQVAEHRHAAVGLDVGGMVRIADQAARRVTVARQQADQAAGDLPMTAGDEDVHAVTPSANARCAGRAAAAAPRGRP